MNNKLKYLFLLAVCAGVGFSGGGAVNVSAQSNSRNYADKIIQYYEWLFETSFTGAERSRYQAIKAADFQTDLAATKKSSDELIENFANIKSKNQDEQERARGWVMNTLIKDLRGRSSDKEAELLVSIYDRKQAEDARAVEANGTGDLSAYVGKWVWAHTGVSLLVGGVYDGGNGSRYAYEFSPNGDVQYTGILSVMQGSCNQQVFESRRGKASVSGNNLTISWQPEKLIRDFSCDAANNYTKTLPARVEKLKVSFKTNLGQKQMCFLGAECFSQTK